MGIEVSRAIGYVDENNGRRAIKRHLPQNYVMWFEDIVKRHVRRDVPQDDAILLKEPCLYCFLLRCKIAGAEPFMEWVIETVLPREVRKLASIVEEKDAAIALPNDNLQDRDYQIQAIQYDSVGLQRKIRAKRQQMAALQRRYVCYLSDEDKNIGASIIAKNNDEVECSYISICGQHGYRRHKVRVLVTCNKGSTLFANGDTPIRERIG